MFYPGLKFDSCQGRLFHTKMGSGMMPSAKWLQKGQSSFRNIKKKRSCLCTHIALPRKSRLSVRLAKAGRGSPRLTAACSWLSQVRQAALMTKTGCNTSKEGGSWPNTQ